MRSLKRVKVRRERASFPALVIAFLVFSIVFYLTAVSVQTEKAIESSTAKNAKSTREIEIEKAEYYLISLCESDKPETVRLNAARNMQRGAAGYLFEKEGRYYSVGNVYFSKTEAEKMIAHLTKGGMDAKVISVSSKGVTLRVTADQAVLDAAEFAARAFSEWEKSMMDISKRIDRGDLSGREACVLLSVLAYDLGKERSTAEAVSSGAQDHAVKRMMDVYLHMLDQTALLTKNEGGEGMLSARIKHAAIAHVQKRISMCDDFLNQN